MEQNITTHTFKRDDTWETIDTLWYSPFFYWQKNGLQVTPKVPLRIITFFGTLIDESNEGWINTGGPSAILLQKIQARGVRGQTIRVETGEEIVEAPETSARS
ncbi:MAG TPA: hypothetical protein VGB85_15840 [Nannocystis sp.]|jgi:hypothetical protein